MLSTLFLPNLPGREDLHQLMEHKNKMKTLEQKIDSFSDQLEQTTKTMVKGPVKFAIEEAIKALIRASTAIVKAEVKELRAETTGDK